MPEDIRTLAVRITEQHQFLRDHAKNEENALDTIDKTLTELLQETRASTQNSIRATDIAEERWRVEKDERERRATQAAELAKIELEQRGKVTSWFQAQWDKYGQWLMLAALAIVAPQVVPQVLAAMGYAPPAPHVVVEQPAPAPMPAPPTNASEPE